MGNEDYYKFVAGKLNGLLTVPPSPTNSGILSRLRRWSPTKPETDAVVLRWMADMPLTEWDEKHPQVAAPRETAFLTVGSLMAVHFQKAHANPLENGIPFATAIAQIAGDKDNGITRRFTALLSSKTYGLTYKYLRALVQFAASAKVPIDYVQLACDLVDFLNPRRQRQVIAKWSRQFARKPKSKTDSSSK